MAGFDLAGREIRKRYLILDQETLAILRGLEPGISNSHLLASALFLAWIELATDRALYFQQQEMGLGDEQLLEIREGRVRIWIESSFRQLHKNLGEVSSINTIRKCLVILVNHDLIETEAPQTQASETRYCWHPELWHLLLRDLRNGGVSPMTHGVSGVTQGVSGATQRLSSVTQSGNSGDTAAVSPMTQGRISGDTPIDREEGKETNKKEEEDLLTLFSRPGKPETAAELLARHSLPELERILRWAQDEPFWSNKVDSIDRFARHLLNGKLGEQFETNYQPLTALVRERIEKQ
jgi:hypothetical protein